MTLETLGGIEWMPHDVVPFTNCNVVAGKCNQQELGIVVAGLGISHLQVLDELIRTRGYGTNVLLHRSAEVVHEDHADIFARLDAGVWAVIFD